MGGVFSWWTAAKPANFSFTYQLQWILVILLGIGSAVFHGSLTLLGQHMDEDIMVLISLNWIYSVSHSFLAPHKRVWLITAMLCYGFLFLSLHHTYHWVEEFQNHFILLIGLSIPGVVGLYKQGSTSEKRCICIMVTYLILSSITWLVDHHLCSQLPWMQTYPPHALWHLFMAMFALMGGSVAFSASYKELDIELKFFTIPLVVFKKDKGE